MAAASLSQASNSDHRASCCEKRATPRPYGERATEYDVVSLADRQTGRSPAVP